MRAECAEVKFTSDQKLAEAHGMMTSVEEKSLEVDAKLRAADAKLAEASRKSSEIERKLLDVTTRESMAQRELASINAEYVYCSCHFRTPSSVCLAISSAIILQFFMVFELCCKFFFAMIPLRCWRLILSGSSL